MGQPIETIYEDKVFKPITPLKGINEHEKVTLILCNHPEKQVLHKISGTLSQDEAEEMQKDINREFERIEGEW